MKKQSKEIKINDRWSLTTDEYNYILMKWGKNTNPNAKNPDKLIVKDKSFPSSIKGVLRHILNSDVRDNINNLQEISRRIEEVEKSFDKFLKAYLRRNNIDKGKHLSNNFNALKGFKLDIIKIRSYESRRT